MLKRKKESKEERKKERKKHILESPPAGEVGGWGRVPFSRI